MQHVRSSKPYPALIVTFSVLFLPLVVQANSPTYIPLGPKIAPALLQTFLGLTFVTFGIGKLCATKEGKRDQARVFEAAKMRPGIFFVYAAGIIELLLGILLTVGIYIKITASLTAVIMLIAIITKKSKPELRAVNMRYFLALMIISIYIVLSEIDSISLDRLT